LITCAFQ